MEDLYYIYVTRKHLNFQSSVESKDLCTLFFISRPIFNLSGYKMSLGLIIARVLKWIAQNVSLDDLRVMFLTAEKLSFAPQ